VLASGLRYWHDRILQGHFVLDVSSAGIRHSCDDVRRCWIDDIDPLGCNRIHELVTR
jgi:hypothetical protein